MEDKIKKGSFLIEKQKHLQEFSSPKLRYYKSTMFAGQAGRMLGKLRSHEVITNIDKILQFGADLGIYDDNILLDIFLPELEKYGSIDIYKDNSGTVKKIEEDISSENDILKTVSEIYEGRNPTFEEQASLEILDYCAKLPRVKTELDNYIAAKGFEKELEISIELAKNFQIIREYEAVPGISENVYHTPLYSRENVVSISNILKKLPEDEKNNIEKLLSTTQSTEANPLSKMNIDQNRLNCYNKVGLIDITNVNTIDGRSESYLFTPAIWGPLGSTLTKDEQEHVRALLSCVRFGQICPTEVDNINYRIKSPELYISALIRNGKVGPSTPIGSDYIILEREGIVKIEKARFKNNQYNMILIKEDVAERARRIISRGRDISIDSDKENIRPLAQVGTFRNPAQNRIRDLPKLKKTGIRSEILEKEMMKLFRREKD